MNTNTRLACEADVRRGAVKAGSHTGVDAPTATGGSAFYGSFGRVALTEGTSATERGAASAKSGRNHLAHEPTMKVIQVKQRTPEWHEYRARRITGSTAAAILGASKYGTPLTEWLRLTGRRVPERVETPWMTWGTLMEPVNAELYRRRHPERELVQEEHMVEHPEFSWLAFSPDGFWMVRGTGQKGLWEAKAPSPFNDEWKKRIPLDNAIQCQIGMACTGDSHASVSALIWPGVLTFELERDQRFLDVAIPKLVEFMECHVRRDIPPAATGSDLDTDALATIVSSDAAWTMTAEVEDLWNKYASADAQRKDAEARVDAIKNRLVQLTGRTMWKEAKAAIESARKLKAV